MKGVHKTETKSVRDQKALFSLNNPLIKVTGRWFLSLMIYLGKEDQGRIFEHAPGYS